MSITIGAGEGKTVVDEKILKQTFVIGFSFALEALILKSDRDIGWNDLEKNYPERLRNWYKIPGTVRIIQDRFAKFFQDCRLPSSWYQEMRTWVFEQRECICRPNDPCDYHAVSCTTCSPKCVGHPSSQVV